MTLTKDEYLKASNALATGFGPTVDFTDPQIGGVAQGENSVPTSAADLPGQVFTVDQLPDPAVAVAYGLPPVRVPAHLILDDADNALKHVQAKDPLDLVSSALREELGHPVLSFDNTVRSADDSLANFSAVTGAGLADGGAPEDTAFVDGIKDGQGAAATTSGGIDGPIDPEGVQRDPDTGEPVSAEAGNQGERVSEAPGGESGPEQKKAGDDKDKDAGKADSKKR